MGRVLQISIIAALLALPTGPAFAAKEELPSHVQSRIERQLDGKVVTSKLMPPASGECYTATIYTEMGGKPMPLQQQRCKMPDGTEKIGQDYEVQFLTRQGQVHIVIVNPDAGTFVRIR